MNITKTDDIDLRKKEIGIRIRKARTDASLTIKTLSEKAGVSVALLGMVERGTRTASQKLIECVSAETGVPVDWLQNGDRVDEKGSKPNQSQTPRVADIDAALFLALIMREDPSVSEETVATFLNVDQDALKTILDGTLKFDPAWKSAFTTLAQRLKIPDILSKLYVIESFLERVEMEKMDSALIKAIKSSLSEKFGDEFTWFDEPHDYQGYVDIRESYKGKGVPVRSFTFMQKSTTTRWNVAVYSELRGNMLEQLLYMLKNPPDNIIIDEDKGTTYIDDACNIQNEAIVFIKEENFREALSFVDKLGRSSDSSPKVAIMHLNPDTMLIECEAI